MTEAQRTNLSPAEPHPQPITPTDPHDAPEARMSQQEPTAERPPMTPGCRCGAGWPGNTVCHCSRCHTTFTTAGNFDRHRRDGACLPPDACGLELKQRAGYVVWGMPGRDDEAQVA